MNNQQNLQNNNSNDSLDVVAIEAERSFLSLLFAEPGEDPAAAPINHFGKDTVKSFVNPKYRIVYETMLELAARNQTIDIITLSNELDNRDQLTTVGGIPMLTELADIESSQKLEDRIKTANNRYNIMKEHFLARAAMQAAQNAFHLAKGKYSGDHRNIMGYMQSAIDAYNVSSMSAQTPKSILAVLRENAKKKEAGEDVVPRILTGLPELDGYLKGGFVPKRLYLIGGRPGMGKTLFAANLAVAAVNQGKRIIYFSLEMSDEAIANRMVAAETGMMMDKVEDVTLCNAEEKKQFYRALEELEAKWKFDIVDMSGLTVGDVANRIRKEKAINNVDLVIIDHLHLLKPDIKCENQTAAVSYVADGLLAIAKNVAIPVVALAQLNRDVTISQSKIPTLASLRGSGSLEQNADVVMFLHRPAYYDKDKNPEYLQVFVEKNRSGITGEIQMRSQLKISKVTEEKVPEERPYYSEYAMHRLTNQNKKRRQNKDDDPLLEIPW